MDLTLLFMQTGPIPTKVPDAKKQSKNLQGIHSTMAKKEADKVSSDFRNQVV